MRIEKIKLRDLLQFVNSPQYASFENKPISIIRAASYVENPRANNEDVVLYMAFIKNKLIAYRTILSDTFFIENKAYKFGWLSGSWVQKNYRRKNISTILYKEVYKDWNGKLMYSNYAIASKAVYDKTNTFETLTTLKGYRFYRRFSLAELVVPKHPIFKNTKPVLKGLDWILNLINDLKLKQNRILLKDISYKKIRVWNDELISYLNYFKNKELFQRNEKVYQWIKNKPWIKTDKSTKNKAKEYYFSSFAENFLNDFYVLKNTNTIFAIINIQIRNKHLKTPYIYFNDKEENKVKNFILKICNDYNIDYVTIYNKPINDLLIRENFIKYKKFEQNFFITKNLVKKHINIKNKVFHSGDGDSVFT